MTMKVLLAFGTRPEAIKLAPVVHELHRYGAEIEPIVCSTGQHREMLDQVTTYFGIGIDLNLDLMQPDQTLAELTSRCVAAMDDAIQHIAPQCIVVQGDTTSVMAAGLAAFYRRIPLVHVEAGLRTYNMLSPWPEELNRRVASLVTALHCAPTAGAARNLLQEGIPSTSVHVTGNTVIDALLWTVQRERNNADIWNQKYGALGDRRLVLITGHRRENFGQGFQDICSSIASLAKRFSDVMFIYPVHLNPNVQKPVHKLLGHLDNVQLVPPAAYPEFVWLMDRSSILLTDSGGVQEEGPSLKKPVLVMRETTERPEAMEAGAVELVGTSPQRIVERMSTLLTDPEEYARHQIETNPYGDGKAAPRIVKLILQNWK